MIKKNVIRILYAGVPKETLTKPIHLKHELVGVIVQSEKYPKNMPVIVFIFDNEIGTRGFFKNNKWIEMIECEDSSIFPFDRKVPLFYGILCERIVNFIKDYLPNNAIDDLVLLAMSIIERLYRQDILARLPIVFYPIDDYDQCTGEQKKILIFKFL